MKKNFILLFIILSIANVSLAQPSNDLCSGATVILPDGSCTSGTLVSGNDDWVGSPGCQLNGPEVWYQFTSTGLVANFVITKGTMGDDVELIFGDGDCTLGFTTTSVCGASPLITTITGLTIGTVYYFSISSSSSTAGTFTSCVTTPPPPANDDCAGAEVLTPGGACATGTTVGATDYWAGTVGCQAIDGNPDVFYSFVSTGTQANFTTTNGTMTGDVELSLFSGACGATFFAGLSCGASPLSSTINGLTAGATYYYTISSSTASQGTFTTCVSTTTPPVTSGQDCSTAAVLCDNTAISQGASTAGVGTQELAGNTCLGTDERQSKWFKFTVGQSGTFGFILSPNVSTDDYDFAMFDITTACPTNATASIACNYAGTGTLGDLEGCTGISILGVPAGLVQQPGMLLDPVIVACAKDWADPDFQPYAFYNETAGTYSPLNLVAGNSYAILVDNFSTTNNGFTLTFQGTATIGQDVAFTMAVTNCGLTVDPVKTITTSNCTFLWSFGDGTTSTLENPPAHTYAVAGSYTVTLTLTDQLGCITTSSQVVSAALADAGPDQIICEGETATMAATIGGSSVSGAWSGGTGVFSSTTSATAVYTPSAVDIASGTITLTWTPNIAGPTACPLAADQMILTINPGPVATFSYTGTPYCSNEVNPSPSYGAGGVAGNFSSTAGLVFISTATGEIDLSLSTAGTYSVDNTVAAASGCPMATASSPITITALPAAPVIGTITHPTCSTSTGSVDLSGLPAVGAWTVTSSPGALTSNSSGTTGTFTGLSAGTTYTFTVTSVSGCTSVASANAIINAQPTTPTTPVIGTITQPTCSTATGSVALSGLPAAGAWTVTSSPGALTLNSSGTTGTFTGLLESTTYTFTVTSVSGCTSVASSNVIINAQPTTPTAPIIGTITQPDCSTPAGSVDLSGLPAAGAWTVTASPGGLTLNSSGTTATFTGLPPNTYTFTVTSISGCTSVASANALINVVPGAPGIPVIDLIIQPTCLISTGDVDLSNLPAVGAWTVTASPGGVTISGSGPTTTGSFIGLTAGVTYTFIVVDVTTCNSSPSANAIINVQPTTPTTPVIGTITQPTCSTATGSVALSGLPAAGAWTVTASPGGATISGSGPTTTGTFTGLSPNTYTFTVASISGCTSVASANVIINAQPTTPTAPVIGTITQPTCLVITGSVALSGLPAVGAWTVTSSPGALTLNSSGTTVTFTGLSASTTYTFTVTSISGCTSVASANVIISAIPIVPAITSTTTMVGCAVAGVIQLNNTDTPAAVTAVTPWLSSNVSVATISSTGLVNGIAAGTSTITYTNNIGCTVTQDITINPNPTINGTLTVCEGFDTQLTGSGTPDGTAPWSSSSIANATVSNNGLVDGILAGTSDITYTDINGCFTASTVTINLTPTTPSLSADVNYCSSATPDDLVAVAGFAGTLNWYSDPTLLVNIGTGATLSPSMTVGTNNYYVTETLNGCEGPASSTVQIITLCDIEIPTAFTPDADKVNDNWELKFLDQTFPNNQVRVYNRWGNLLFESEKGKYETKPFDGKYNGEDLPVASYYFIIEYNNAEEESKTGNVTIIRK